MPSAQPYWVLLPLLVQQAVAAGGSIWYKYEYESNYVEDVLLIIMVTLALAFEVVFHSMMHMSEHSYAYGHYHNQANSIMDADAKDSHGNMKHLRLYQELVSRMGGEFMSLGFLAFLIFVVNQTGGFDNLATRFPECTEKCWHMPVTAGDWLHMAELVHVKLFLGMLLYFVLMLALVRGSVAKIKEWEKVRLRRMRSQENEPSPHLRFADSALDQHIIWRDYFIERVLRWRESRPRLFRKVLATLEIEDDANADRMLRTRADERFSLSAYLSLNLEVGVGDSIQVHVQTWCVVIGLFGFFALLHRFAKVSLHNLLPIFIGVSFVLFIVMYLASRERQAKIRKYVRMAKAGEIPATPQAEKEKQETADEAGELESGDLDQEGDKVNLHQRLSTERILLRTLQVFMFLICYIFARTLADVDSWTDHFERTLLQAVLFSLLFGVLSKFIPRMVPIFLAMMSFPPYVDEVNLAAFFAVLVDDHARGTKDDPHHKAHQEHKEETQLVDSPPVHGERLSGQAKDQTVHSMEAIAASNASQESLAAVRELASILGVSGELERRLRERKAAPEAKSSNETAF